jgi:LCP family protein required for cell wall assembly
MMSHHSLHHVSDSDLIAYAHQQLTDAQREVIDQHLEACLDCRRRLLDHADLQRRLNEGLSRQLAEVSPTTGWSAIAPRVRTPRHRRGLFPRLSGLTGTSRRIIYATLAAAYAVAVLVGAFLLFNVFRDFVRDQETVSLVDERPTPTVAPTPVLGGATITSAPTPEPTPTVAGPPVWDGQGRVNLLVMGIDQRENQGGYWRTDTMIILTIDPGSQTVGMISIPRDLWVPIWGYDVENRINTAHYYGDSRDYPGGGPALARDTVAYNLGIPIHHYVRLNFTAFERLIDEIGGIDVYVESAISDPQYPDEGIGYDPFYLSAGQHHLDGRTALKYARTRHGTSDFARARRQQQVILAVRDQIVKLNQLPRLIANGPQILNTLGDSVRTDLSFDQAVQLAQILNTIPADAYRSAVIDQSYTQPYTTDTGAQVLIPLRDKIATLYEGFFQGP